MSLPDHPDDCSQPTPSPVPASGQAVTTLLDLRHRGVIDDAQFAALTRDLTGASSVATPRLGRRGVTARLSRGAVLVGGAAALVLATAGISLAVLPDAHQSRVAVAEELPVQGALDAEDRTAPVAADEPKADPSPSAAHEQPSPAAPARDAEEQVASDDAPQAPVAQLPAHAPPAPVPAAVAPVAVPAPREVARVDCRAYAFEKEDLRITYEADLANINISWNIALNTGALDEAARLQGEADATQQQRSLDEARLQAQYPGC